MNLGKEIKKDPERLEIVNRIKKLESEQKFDIDVDINGRITFEVEARNKNEAKAKVDELLQNTALKEALEKYQNNVSLEMKVRADRSLER